MEKNENQRLREAILEVINTQIQDNDPPETKRTLERLMSMGESRKNAIRYIGSVLSVEIFEALQNQSPYDEGRYVENLKALPKLRFEDE